MTLARIVIERCHYLAGCSEEEGAITRPFASGAMTCAHGLVSEWMEEAGMVVLRDNIGNLRGGYAGTGSATLLLGSHLDSVRNAGKYDGPLGVAIAIAAVQRLHDAGRRLPFAIEVLAFADEEGLRYGSTFLGSRAFVGRFDPRDLERTDASGITMAEAIRTFGGDPQRVAEDSWSGSRPLGYVEVHIEQGPVLETRSLPVGVVTAITGGSRFRLTFIGEAGHAGTVPMNRRRDALAAASEFVLAAEAAASSQSGAVATVGQLAVEPGASNVIPDRATMSLDVRHLDTQTKLQLCEALLARARDIARRRKLMVEVQSVSENTTVHCGPHLIALLAQSVKDSGHPVFQLPSGAGHDAGMMSSLTDVGMLFVRCKGGISHNPAESVKEEDVQVALDVLSRFLELLSTA